MPTEYHPHYMKVYFEILHGISVILYKVVGAPNLGILYN